MADNIESTPRRVMGKGFQQFANWATKGEASPKRRDTVQKNHLHLQPLTNCALLEMLNIEFEWLPM